MDLGLLILRFVVGLTLAAHGAQKLFGWFGGYGLDGTGPFMEALGFHPGRRHAALAGLTEAGGGYEYNLVLAAAAVSVAFSGPGVLSIDALLGYSFAGTLWGIGAIVVAVVGALVQLAQRHPSAAAGHVSTAA